MNFKLSKEIKVGVFGLIAGLMFYGGFKFLKGSDFFSTKYTYYAIYKNIEGLTVSNPVMINGYAVGRVGKIKIMPHANNKIKVYFNIDREIVVDSATKAIIINSDLLGSKAIKLEPGNSSKRLPGNSRVKSGRQQGITQEIQQQTAPLITKLDTALARLNELTNPTNQKHIQNTLANIEKSSQTFDKYLKQNQQNVHAITKNLVTMTDSLIAVQKSLRPAIRNMKHFSDSLKTLKVNRTLSNIDSSVNSLKQVITKINNGQGTIGKSINDSSLYKNLNQTTTDLDSLIKDIKANPKKYVNFSLFGNK